MYDQILLPTDGSEGARAAVSEAIDLAEQHDATLHLLYVVDTSAASGIPESHVSNLENLLEVAGERALSDVAEAASTRGIDYQQTINRGPVHTAIIDYADANDIDLIVMATHGRSGIDRVLLGSVTERVIKQATPPVLVVRSRGQQG